MADISEHKFTESDFTSIGASSLPDRPKDAGMNATQVKAALDAIGKTLIALGNFNDLIDNLLATTDGSSGADSIGVTAISGVTGTTAQAVLENLKTQLDNAIIGEFSPSGISTAMMADGAITNDKMNAASKPGLLADLTTTIKTSLVSAINELDSDKEESLVSFVDDTASRTLALTDARKKLRANHATVAINYTVPPNADVAFPIGTWIIIEMTGAAQVAVVAGSGVTINPSTKLKVNGQNTSAVLVKEATDTWSFQGSVKA